MIPTDFDTGDNHEGIMDVVASLVADAKTSILMQPRETAFNYPPIDSKSTTIASAPSSQNWLDTFLTKLLTVWFAVVAAITKHRSRTSQWPADLSSNSRDRADQRQQMRHIVTVGTGQSHRQRDAVGISHHMVLRAFFAAVRRIWPGFRPPKMARTEAESTTAREKSIWSACRNLLSKTWWILSQMPAFCQSRRRRQQVMPEPQPISCGRSSHEMPVLSTKRIPVRTARSGTGFRPGYRNLRFFFGIMGSMICHSSSFSIGFAMSSLPAVTSNTQLLMSSVTRPENISFC
jgi:hypothetical protein